MHFWDNTKFVSESLPMSGDTVDGKGGIFQILRYSSHCSLPLSLGLSCRELHGAPEGKLDVQCDE